MNQNFNRNIVIRIFFFAYFACFLEYFLLFDFDFIVQFVRRRFFKEDWERSVFIFVICN